MKTTLKPGTYSKTFKFEREATEYWMNSSVRATQAGLRSVKNEIEYNKDWTYTVTTTYAK